MPIYVYKCDNGHQFEAMQSMADDPLESCEVCGAPARRLLFAPAVHFKGSGFYTTDYAKKGAVKPKSDSGDGAGDSKSGSEKKGAETGSKPKSEGKASNSKAD